MYGEESGEFVCEYQGLKGHTKVVVATYCQFHFLRKCQLIEEMKSLREWNFHELTSTVYFLTCVKGQEPSIYFFIFFRSRVNMLFLQRRSISLLTMSILRRMFICLTGKCQNLTFDMCFLQFPSLETLKEAFSPRGGVEGTPINFRQVGAGHVLKP